MRLQVYLFDKYGFFIDLPTFAQPNPEEPDNPLIPSDAVTFAPLELAANQCAKLNADATAWEVLPDLRGTKYWLNDVEYVVTERGVSLPEGAVTEKPAGVIAQELDRYKSQASAAINAERDKRIWAGIEFPSGSGVFFDSDEIAQKNVNGAVTMCMLAQAAGQSFSQDWITLDNNVVTLDAAGITGLGVTLGRHIGKHQLQAREYKDTVAESTTRDDIDAAVKLYINTDQNGATP